MIQKSLARFSMSRHGVSNRRTAHATPAISGSHQPTGRGAESVCSHGSRAEKGAGKSPRGHQGRSLGVHENFME